MFCKFLLHTLAKSVGWRGNREDIKRKRIKQFARKWEKKNRLIYSEGERV